ncbi:MAG: hypothetical protein WCK28_17025 [Burkholderiales bacterium]|jgi:hypothetical protein
MTPRLPFSQPWRRYSPAVEQLYAEGMREAGAALAGGEQRAALFALGAAWEFPSRPTPLAVAVRAACERVAEDFLIRQHQGG